MADLTLSIFHEIGSEIEAGTVCLLEGKSGQGEKIGMLGHITASLPSTNDAEKRGSSCVSIDRLEVFMYAQCRTRSRKDDETTAADILLDRANKVEERFMKTVMRTVQGPLDIVIDPNLDEEGWLPHTENGEVLAGAQKSKVGECLTIGDSASDAGLFLSFDGGETYLLDPVESVPKDDGQNGGVARHGWKPPPRPPSAGRKRDADKIAKFAPGKLREKGGTEWMHTLGRPRQGSNKSPRNVDSPTKMLLPGETMPVGRRVALKEVPSLNCRPKPRASPKRQEPQSDSPTKAFEKFKRESALKAAAELELARKQAEDEQIAINKKYRKEMKKKKVNAILMHRYVSTHPSNRGTEVGAPSEFSTVEYLVEWADTGLQQWLEKPELLQYPEPVPTKVKNYTTSIVARAASLRGGVGVQNMTIKGGPTLEMPAMTAMFEAAPPQSTSISSSAQQSSAMRKRRVRRIKTTTSTLSYTPEFISEPEPANQPEQQTGGMTKEMLMEERLQQFREEMELRIAKLEEQERAAKKPLESF